MADEDQIEHEQHQTSDESEQPTPSLEGNTESRTQSAEAGETPATVESLTLESEDETPQSVPYSRFNEVYYQKKRAEKELEQLRAQQHAQQPKIDDSNKPKLADFDYDEEKFNDALLDWKLEQRDKIARQRQHMAEQEKKFTGFRTKQEAYIQKNPGYAQLAHQADAAGIEFNEALANMIMGSETGVQIHHHLLSNPAKLEQLNRADPMTAMREIVRLEANFNRQKPKPISKTPDPITTSQGGAADPKPSNERLAKMSPAEYYEYRMAQKQKR